MAKTDTLKSESTVESTPQKYGRKVLQVLQPSVQNILVGSSGNVSLKVMSEKKSSVGSVLKPSKNKKLDMPKENSPRMVRRSQRKRAEVIQNVEAPPVNVKKANSKGIKKEKTSSRSSKKKSSKTEKLVSNIIPDEDVLNEASDNVFSPVVEEKHDNQSLSPDLMYLVTDETPEHYWKELAEQRQAALEETLRENESLYDQLTVLLAENEQLSSVVESARELASFLVDKLKDSDCPVTKEDLSFFFKSEESTPA